MFEALRRDKLEWEKITLKGKKRYDIFTYSDGTSINYMNTIAVRGKFNTKNLGFCNNCRKIMTQKEFEKHRIQKMNIKECNGCYHCQNKNTRLVRGKDGNYVRKSDVVCKVRSTYYEDKWIDINKDNPCYKKSCIDSKFIPFDSNFKEHPCIALNKRILTIKAFEDWKIDTRYRNYMRFVCPDRTSLIAYVDNNGYLINFEFRDRSGYWNEEKDEFFSFEGSIIDMAERTKKIIRRLYDAAD